MRAIITSDWQAEFSNLDLCEQAWRQVLNICQEQKLETVVLAGDLKQHYNPVDIRVTKWWMRAIERAIKAGLEVIVVLGNHDRVGQYTDAQNWLPILRRAGAKVFDKPCFHYTGKDEGFAILPYTTDVKRLKREARQLAKRATKKDVLLFHADLKGCAYNALGKKSESRLTHHDLQSEAYLACVGGHIHLYQRLGKNTYYTGSPFCSDWGEANQRKGFVVVEDRRIGFVPSRIPGWFDNTYPNFPSEGHSEDNSWAGARVKVHVSCSVDGDYQAALARARRLGEKKYKGATVFVVPEFKEASERRTVHVDVKDTDKEKIAAYVEQTLPKELLVDKKRIISYLNYQLGKIGVRIRRGSKIKFLWTKATNFLSYKNLELDFRSGGIVVIKGEYAGRPERSNGSGKTNCLQTIPVAWFGKTFKGETYDGWANRHTEGEARVTVAVRDSNGNKIAVTRGRRPSSLKLSVNAKDVSSGMDGRRKDATQGFIEQFTGYTWQTLANAVYIDETVTRAFLSGTAKERTQVLSRFQNLERFEEARKLVRADASHTEKRIDELKEKVSGYDNRISDCKDAIAEIEKQKTVRVQDAKKKLKDAEREAAALNKIENKRHGKLIRLTKKLEKRMDATSNEIQIARTQSAKLEYKMESLTEKIDSAKELKGECPTCYQKVSPEHIQSHVKGWKYELEGIEDRRKEILRQIKILADKFHAYEDRISDATESLNESTAACTEATSRVNALERVLLDAKTEATSPIPLERRLRKLKAGKKSVELYIQSLAVDLPMFTYCDEAFSRDGLPAFLNAQLVPVLNGAADYYSELFSGKELQVRFTVVNGEFEPVIVNASGGETFASQSKGEKALAGLIASFALREVAPVCNLLILDEPGDGLDPAAARRFAQSLSTLKDKFGTIYLTTFNPEILQSLANEKTITVVKKNGISSLIN